MKALAFELYKTPMDPLDMGDSDQGIVDWAKANIFDEKDWDDSDWLDEVRKFREHVYDPVAHKSSIKIYRAMNLESADDYKKENFGVSWSFDKRDNDYVRSGRLGQHKLKTFLFTGEANPKDIDWGMTLMAFIKWVEQNECRLKKGAKVKITQIDEKPVTETVVTASEETKQTSFLPDKLVMVDCEMTGVDETQHELLQAAFLKLELQDGQYVETAEPLVLYLQTDAQPSCDFHHKYLTHIFKACNESTLQPYQAAEQLHQWLGDWVGKIEPVGDCVHTDLAFLKQNGIVQRNNIVDDEQVPGTFHYENFEMNPLKAFARTVRGEKYAVADIDEEHIHDALVDCRNQTKELNSYVQIMLEDYVGENKRVEAMNDELQSFIDMAGKGYHSYEYLMSPKADNVWAEQEQYNKDEGNEEQTREEWARSEDEFHQTSGDPSMCFDIAKKVKPSEWLIHFTDANPMDIIKTGFHGTSFDVIGLTTYYKDGTNPGDLALAYRVEDVPRYSRHDAFGKYGKNAVIFRAKEAARAWHFGDEEYQTVFAVSTVTKSSMYPVYGTSDGLELYDPKKLEPVIAVNRNTKGLEKIMDRVRTKNMKPDVVETTVESAFLDSDELITAGKFKEIAIEEEDRALAGKKGDWKAEGYTIKEKNPMSSWANGGDWIIEAFDPKGKKCGELRVYDLGPTTMTSSDTRVDPKHRRKGLASAMYEYAEKKSGKRMIPAEEASEDPDNFSKDAEKLWNQPNRSFGGAEVSPEEAFEALHKQKDPPNHKDLKEFQKYTWQRQDFPLSDVTTNGGEPISEPMWTEGYKKPSEPWDLETYEKYDQMSPKDPNGEEARYVERWGDEFYARKYAKLTTKAPPVFIVWDPEQNRYRFWNGRHRSRAAFLRGEKTIDAYVGMPKEPVKSFYEKPISKKAGRGMKKRIKAAEAIMPSELPTAVQPAEGDDGQLPEDKKAIVESYNSRALRSDSFQDFQELLNNIMLDAQLTEVFRPSVAGLLNEYRVAEGYVAL